MMLRRKSKHLHTAIEKEFCPVRRVESDRIPRPIKLLITLPLLERHSKERPRLTTSTPDRIETPMDAYTILHVPELLVSTIRCPVIAGQRAALYVRRSEEH